MAKDPKDFGDVPKVNKDFKPPTAFPSDKNGLLALVAAKGGLAPRAARWMAPREVRAFLAEEYPFESSNILAVRTPRQIANAGDLLTLAADRRLAYRAQRRSGEARAQPSGA